MKALYTILEESNNLDLAIKVEKYMESGWKTQGGVSISNFMYISSGSPRHMQSCCQAMIKEKTE